MRMDANEHAADSEPLPLSAGHFFLASFIGFIASGSLTIGSITGVVLQPNSFKTGLLYAFGAGALFAALGVVLIAPTVANITDTLYIKEHGRMTAKLELVVLAILSLVGGGTFLLLDELFSNRGSKLRKVFKQMEHSSMPACTGRTKTVCKEETLGQAPKIFKVLTTKRRQQLCRHMQYVCFHCHDVIFTQGDESNRLWIIKAGKVEQQMRPAECFHLSSAGEMLGSVAFLTAKPQIMTAVAATDVEAYSIDYKHFIPLVEEEPALKLALVTDVAEFLGVVSKDNQSVYESKERLLRAWMANLGDLARLMGNDLQIPSHPPDQPCDMYEDLVEILSGGTLTSWTEPGKVILDVKDGCVKAESPQRERSCADELMISKPHHPVSQVTATVRPAAQPPAGCKPSAGRQAVKQQLYADLMAGFASNWNRLMGSDPNPLDTTEVRNAEEMAKDIQSEDLACSVLPMQPSDITMHARTATQDQQDSLPKAAAERESGVLYKGETLATSGTNMLLCEDMRTIVSPITGECIHVPAPEPASSEFGGSHRKYMYDEITASLRSLHDSVHEPSMADSGRLQWIAASADFKGQAPMAVWIGNLMDGVAEAIVIGAQVSHLLASTTDPSSIQAIIPYTLIAALCIANFPEAMAASMTMYQYGWSRLRVVLMWLSLTLIIALGSGLGYLFAALIPEMVVIAVEGFAAGGMLVMIASNMIPEAVHLCGPASAGMSLLCGFTVSYMFELLQA